MHELIAKYFDQEITPEEQKDLFSAMENDKKLRGEFISMQNVRALSSWLPCLADRPEAIGKLLEFKKARKKQSFSIPYKPIFGYVATVCVAIVSTWMLFNSHRPTEKKVLITYEEFSTPSGQRAMVKLHDGTIVWLNARSTLRYPSNFDETGRRVELNGEAFFEVKHNKDIPFIVSTEKLDIQVLGTKFNVFAYKGRDEFNTSLLEGSVKIYTAHDAANALLMKPNERVDLIDNKLVKRTFNNVDDFLWREGIYAFDDVTFDSIVKKLELYYDITIVVNNKKLDSYKFSGKFRQRDGVESVLHTLQKVYPFVYTKNDELNKITIR